jgi:Nuclease-related domain
MSAKIEAKEARAQIFGTPGENARAAGLFRTLWPLFALVAATGYLLGAALPLPGVPKLAYGLGLLLLACLLVRSLNWSQRLLRNYFKGARGEEAAARQLLLLPANYAVFHSVSLPGSSRPGVGDLDHVVIGPNGLFVVETKNWSGHVSVRDGQLLVDGKLARFTPLEQARQGAQALHDWLKAETGHSLAVRPVLNFVASELRGGRAECAGVLVTGGEALRGSLLQDPADQINDGLRLAVVERLSRQVQS